MEAQSGKMLILCTLLLLLSGVNALQLGRRNITSSFLDSKTSASTHKPTSILAEKSLILDTKTSTGTNVWTIALYSKQDCEGDYYLISGVTTDFDQCLELQTNEIPDQPSQTSTWCEWFTDGGMESTSCDKGTINTPVSMELTNATCEVFSSAACSSSSSYIAEYVGEGNGCLNDKNEATVIDPWGSLACSWNGGF
ncbi:uncharacterized protein N7483_004824 [Penicillium malachiteum]|uniref:uncharacterized protein n=1 Tax=Penicillium malachiteum TaxID=1324776 RepID=UPI0025481F3E|nr:uncharacterized protein N7483_004824 [Penicillium malachiteum]KAJ5730316.1 hypothetical protein N7483_004824 [Penicillium malachiteum]